MRLHCMLYYTLICFHLSVTYNTLVSHFAIIRDILPNNPTAMSFIYHSDSYTYNIYVSWEKMGNGKRKSYLNIYSLIIPEKSISTLPIDKYVCTHIYIYIYTLTIYLNVYLNIWFLSLSRCNASRLPIGEQSFFSVSLQYYYIITQINIRVTRLL